METDLNYSDTNNDTAQKVIYENVTFLSKLLPAIVKKKGSSFNNNSML